jgi:hypothetical protein
MGNICHRDEEIEYDSDNEKESEDPKFHPNFKENPTDEGHRRIKKKGRRPTDFCCTILLVLYVVGMIAVAVIAWIEGNPYLLYKPTDFMGRICGKNMTNAAPGTILLPRNINCENSVKGNNQTATDLCEAAVAPYREDLTNRPYLWFMDIEQPLTYGGVCVTLCPGSTTGSYCPPQLKTYYVDPMMSEFSSSSIEYCGYERPDMPNVTFPPSAEVKYLSTELLYMDIMWRCFPDPKILNSSMHNAVTEIDKSMNSAAAAWSLLWSDIYVSWKVLAASAILAFFISLAFLFLVRMFAAIVIWILILFCFAAVSGLSAFLLWDGWTQWQSNKVLGLSTTFDKVIFGFGVALGAIAVIFLLVMLFLFMRIRRAIGIIQEACKAISAMPQIIVMPVVLVVLLVLFSAYWIVVAIYLWSSGKPTISGYTVRYEMTMWTRGLFAYHIFGGLWISQFLIAVEYMIVAGAIGSWYWRRNKQYIVGLPVIRSVLRTLIFHLGTAAFGSLLVAIIEFIRLLFERAHRELKKAMLNNKITQCLTWLVRIFLWLFEAIVKYINKQAYIQCALYGTWFIPSAKNGFEIILRNPVQVGVLDVMSKVIFIILKFSIAASTTLFCYAIATKTTFLNVSNQNVSSPIFITLVCIIQCLCSYLDYY